MSIVFNLPVVFTELKLPPPDIFTEEFTRDTVIPTFIRLPPPSITTEFNLLTIILSVNTPPPDIAIEPVITG